MAKKSDASAYTPRERMVYSAVQLIRQNGVARTGLRDVVTHAKAPWGSLQYYFPGGKDQVVEEAIGWATTYAAGRIDAYLGSTRKPTPSGLFAAMVDQWRGEFATRGFERGCPLLAVAAEVVGDDDSPLQQVIVDAFSTWHRPAAAALRSMGVPRARAASLATLMISALEGAVVMARAQRDIAPLNTVARELKPLLDGAAPAA